jgi:ubiquinone/menaquinone biosynthesis C-methylase UbiE
LSALEVSEGWRCLEVGAGPGSIAIWLSNHVGLRGQVVATDINMRFLERMKRPNLKLLRHDLTTEPLPEGEFDLVHARLVLMHLPEREKALQSLVSALKPNVWLLVEEFDALSIRPEPEVNPFEAALKTNLAMRHIMTQQGLDLRYGRLLMGHLRRLGLVDVCAEGRTSMWQGGSPGADLHRGRI